MTDTMGGHVYEETRQQRGEMPLLPIRGQLPGLL